MDTKKKERLEADGWTIGSVEDFVGTTPLQLAYVDLTIYLADHLKKIRKSMGLTQTDLANLMGSSQSRIAKLERGDSSVSFDLMIRALIHLGIPPSGLGTMIMLFSAEEDDGLAVRAESMVSDADRLSAALALSGRPLLWDEEGIEEEHPSYNNVEVDA